MRLVLPFPRATADDQRGAALLVFMLIFFLAAGSWMLSQAGSSRLPSEADKKTSAALAQAREALIGRAAADNNRPGSLPCPAKDDDGKAELLAGNECPVYVGRFPWKTLDLPELRDGDGHTLWYVLAREVRDDDSATHINPTLALSLKLDDTVNIAAIVFSAGQPLADQNGRPSNAIADYLDGANRMGSPYVSGPASATFNDKLIAISRDQLFNIVNRRIVGLFRTELGKYFVANGNLYPVSGADLKTALAPYLDTATATLLNNNGWYGLTAYTATADRQQAMLAITVPTPITCSITPTQAHAACGHP
jgi:hypothetical protein